jgi:hypothetical protein
MATARELALEVLPHFQQAVLGRCVYTYGHYAIKVGRSSASDSMAIGQAMHALGAGCVLAGVPVAPLFFVERADGEARGVFEGDLAETRHVLPHFDLLYVTAREHPYSTAEFDKIDKALRTAFPAHLKPTQLSPHDLWHVLIYAKLKDGKTILEKSLENYRELFAQLKKTRP